MRAIGKQTLRRKTVWLGVVACLALAVPACAGLPTGAAGAGAAGATGLPGAAAAAQPNIWSFLCPNPAQKLACMSAFCTSGVGQMVSGFAGPVMLMTGGLAQNCCANNAIANGLQKAADSPEGAAARIKADEADAAARRAAVRYLGTVDCERWPEATETLKNALRKDRNECVRLEAALALRNGCCCNAETIEALKNCVAGEMKKDPNPVERCDRVRAVAAEALARCVLVEPPVPLRPLEPLPPPLVEAPLTDPEYYKRIARLPRQQVVESARAVLASFQNPGKDPEPIGPPTPIGPPAGAPAGAPVGPPVGPPIIAGVPLAPVVIATPAPVPTSLAGILKAALVGGHCDGATPGSPLVARLTRTLMGKQELAQPLPCACAPPVPAAAPPHTNERAPATEPLPRPLPATPERVPPPMPAPPTPPEARAKGSMAQHLVMPPALDAAPPRPARPALVMPPAADPARPPMLPDPAVQLLGPVPTGAGAARP